MLQFDLTHKCAWLNSCSSSQHGLHVPGGRVCQF